MRKGALLNLKVAVIINRPHKLYRVVNDKQAWGILHGMAVKDQSKQQVIRFMKVYAVSAPAVYGDIVLMSMLPIDMVHHDTYSETR